LSTLQSLSFRVARHLGAASENWVLTCDPRTPILNRTTGFYFAAATLALRR
jgi:hypothetical protein